MTIDQFKKEVAAVAKRELWSATAVFDGVRVEVKNDRALLILTLEGEGIEWAHPQWELSRAHAVEEAVDYLQKALAGEFRLERPSVKPSKRKIG